MKDALNRLAFANRMEMRIDKQVSEHTGHVSNLRRALRKEIEHYYDKNDPDPGFAAEDAVMQTEVLSALESWAEMIAEDILDEQEIDDRKATDRSMMMQERNAHIKSLN